MTNNKVKSELYRDNNHRVVLRPLKLIIAIVTYVQNGISIKSHTEFPVLPTSRLSYIAGSYSIPLSLIESHRVNAIIYNNGIIGSVLVLSLQKYL